MSSSKACVTIFSYQAAKPFQRCLGKRDELKAQAPAMRNKQLSVEQKGCRGSDDCRSSPGTREGDFVFLQPTSKPHCALQPHGSSHGLKGLLALTCCYGCSSTRTSTGLPVPASWLGEVGRQGEMVSVSDASCSQNIQLLPFFLFVFKPYLFIWQHSKSTQKGFTAFLVKKAISLRAESIGAPTAHSPR